MGDINHKILKFKVSKNLLFYKIIVFIFILIISIFTRFYNLNNWVIMLSDEDNTIKSLSQPLVASDRVSTTLVPIKLLTKYFFFINEFPGYRYISALLNVLVIFIIYFTIKLISNDKIALVGSLLTSIQPVFLYYSRMYEYNSLSLLFVASAIYFYFKWVKTEKNIFLFLSFALLGILTDNYIAIGFYMTFPVLLWISWLKLRKKLRTKTFLISIVIFVLICSIIPYQFNVFHLNPKDYIVGIINRRFELNNKSLFIWFYDKTLVSLHILDVALFGNYYKNFIIAFAFIFTIIFTYFYKIKNKDKNIEFLFWMFIATLVLPFLMPFPAYFPNHFIPFLFFCIFLLVKFLEVKEIKYIAISLISLFLLTSIYTIFVGFFGFPTIFNNDYKAIDSLKEYIDTNNFNYFFVQSVWDGIIKSLELFPKNSTVVWFSKDCHDINSLIDPIIIRNEKIVLIKSNNKFKPCEIDNYLSKNNFTLFTRKLEFDFYIKN